jgi:chromosome segregation ATPase
MMTSEKTERIQELERENKKLREELEVMTRARDTLSDAARDWANLAGKMENEIAKLRAELADSQRLAIERAERIGELEVEIERLREELDEVRVCDTRLAEQIEIWERRISKIGARMVELEFCPSICACRVCDGDSPEVEKEKCRDCWQGYFYQEEERSDG